MAYDPHRVLRVHPWAFSRFGLTGGSIPHFCQHFTIFTWLDGKWLQYCCQRNNSYANDDLMLCLPVVTVPAIYAVIVLPLPSPRSRERARGAGSLLLLNLDVAEMPAAGRPGDPRRQSPASETVVFLHESVPPLPSHRTTESISPRMCICI
jgi:hypothetical protein